MYYTYKIMYYTYKTMYYTYKTMYYTYKSIAMLCFDSHDVLTRSALHAGGKISSGKK